jgi:hypothetical protein
MSRRRWLVTAAVAAVVLVGAIVLIVVLRAPDTPVATSRQPNPSTPATAGTVSTVTPPPLANSPTAPGPSTPRNSPSIPPTQRPDACTTGTVALTWTPQQQAEQLCVHVTSEITLSMPPIDPDRWQRPTSSDPRVATVGPLGLDQDGGTHTTVTAMTPGTTAIRATVRPQDAHDLPPSGRARQLWLLTITVIA